MTHKMLRSLLLLAVAIRAAVSAPWQDNPKTCGLQGPVPGFHVQIAGGHDAENYGWPWMAGIYKADYFICGASVIDPYWLITAAHCLKESPGNYTFRVGSISRTAKTPFTQISRASNVVVHPKYIIVETGKGELDNDIALIKMSTPFNLSKDHEVNSVCLPTKDMGEEFKVGQNVTVTGWGITSKTEANPDILQQVVLPIFNDAACNQTYDWLITNNMICAGKINNTGDFCQGDWGGPLVGLREGNQKQYYLIGIASFNGPSDCGDPIKMPGVYTRVSEYEEWIKTTMNKSTGGMHPSTIALIVLGGVAVLVACICYVHKNCQQRWGYHRFDNKGQRKLTISVCTPADKKYVSGFINKLRDELGEDQRVEYQWLPYDMNVSKINIKRMGIMILCHSIIDIRYPTTDPSGDALYDTFLKNAESTLGKEKVCVIVHDYSAEQVDTKDIYNDLMGTFQMNQPTTFEKASLVLIAGTLNETCVLLPENGFDDIKRFLKIKTCDNFTSNAHVQVQSNIIL